MAVAGSVLLSVIIGSITFRLRGPYFVLASIAMAEIIRLAALHFKDVTRGAEGILLNGIPPLETPWFTVQFLGKVPFFYATLALAVIVISVNWLVQHTKLGYTFQAIREDQDAAHSLGINPTLHKNLALMISAAFTASAGGLFALYVRFIDPNIAFGIDVSVQMVLICIIGGIGTILGPVVGSVVLVLLSETLRNPKWLVQAGAAGRRVGHRGLHRGPPLQRPRALLRRAGGGGGPLRPRGLPRPAPHRRGPDQEAAGGAAQPAQPARGGGLAGRSEP